MNTLPDTRARCVVVGGGPAGMMTGYLLARAGVQVVVLEKHADFNRDFRGDTIHPSTLENMHELGLLEEFLALPHQEVRELRGTINGHPVCIADFSRPPTRCKFIAFMPQWDFLNFLAEHAKRFPTFALHMQHEVTDLIFENRRVAGVRAKTPEGEGNFLGDLIIGADGRHSIVHERAGLEVQDFGVPIDVLWMRLSKGDTDPQQSLGFFRHGKLLVLLDRGDYLQAGFVIKKGGLDEIKQRGLPGLHRDILEIGPFLENRMAELNDWTKIKLLTVQINRLRRWYREGLLCIGDSAHAMSPAGGVGINLALQDAVATANLLTAKLQSGQVLLADLAQVQRRREWPTRVIQRMQSFVHRHVVTGRKSKSDDSLPLVVRLLQWFPALRSLPARFIGIGPRPEHIRSLLVAFVLSMFIAMAAYAADAEFESGAQRVHVIELYTSEGCSSCPPAEAWLSRLKDSSRLWREFVPMAFHVDYWDNLGWRDPFAAKQWTARQYQYSALWKTSSLYTPGFVLDGHEWQNGPLPATSADKPGVLHIRVKDADLMSAEFSPVTNSERSYDLHVARLGFDLEKDVKAGENRGRKLRHDFVVLALTTEPIGAGTKQLRLPQNDPRQNPGSREAIAAWIARSGELEPIQATGGWLR